MAADNRRPTVRIQKPGNINILNRKITSSKKTAAATKGMRGKKNSVA